LPDFDPCLLPTALWEHLKKSIQKKRFPHALLIIGPEGVGKKNLAVGLASLLLSPAGKSLEDCSSAGCRRIQEGNHPDIKWFEDEGEATIKVSQIREAIGWAGLRPFEGENKVLILESVERLSEEALNAFLKLLEEPPASTFILLLAENPAELKKTLLSRCFQISLKPLSKGNIKERLIQKGVSENEAHYVSLFSRGIYKKAEELVSESRFEEDNSKLEMLLSRYSHELVDEVLGTLSGSRKPDAKRNEVGEFLRIAQTFIRDVLIWKKGGAQAEGSLYFKGCIEWIREKSQSENERSLLSKSAHLEELRRGLDRYANPKLSLMAISETIGQPLLGVKND
jgi:DNA polymerase-3 subunit delta'